ncbi:MAG: hypothetical protein ACI9DJ_002308 [Algoriphagus sp.]|jgi:hypothetical protein
MKAWFQAAFEDKSKWSEFAIEVMEFVIPEKHSFLGSKKICDTHF